MKDDSAGWSPGLSPGGLRPGYSISLLAAVMILGSLLLAAFPYLRDFTGPFGILTENMSHFRLTGLALAAIGGIISLRNRRLQFAALAAAILTSLPMLAYSVPTAGASVAARPGRDERLRIAFANMGWPQLRRYDDLLEWLDEAEPDIVAVCEYDPQTSEAIDSRLPEFPHRISAIRSDRYGMALYSRLPVTDSRIEALDRTGLPALSMKLTDPRFEILVIHPHSPDVNGQTEGRAESLRTIAATLSDRDERFLLIGDFNTTERTREFSSLLEAGLRDSRPGFGWSPTWFPFEGSLWPLNFLAGIPLDHAFVSGKLVVTDRTVGPPFGSDHLPIIVEVESAQ